MLNVCDEWEDTSRTKLHCASVYFSIVHTIYVCELGCFSAAELRTTS